MKSTMIDNIHIYTYNDKKYQKAKNNALQGVCKVNNCTTRIDHDGIGYCDTCLDELSGGDRGKMKQLILDDRNSSKEISQKELRVAYHAMLEKEKININGVDIYIIDSKKYRKGKDGSLALACIYDNCNNYGFATNGGIYCGKHRDGIDPNSDIRKKEKADKTAKAKIVSKTVYKTGDDTELWVVNKLKLIALISSAERVGYTGSKYDVEFKLNDENKIRGIQVKTLIKNTRSNDSYQFCSRGSNYSANTLFIGVNKDRTRFTLMFYKDLKTQNPTFTYSMKNPIYKDYMFSDYDKFLIKLEGMLSTTDECDKNCRPPALQQEYDSLVRLKNKCNQNNITYRWVEDSNTKIDCVLNNYNVQHKSSRTKDSFQYQFDITVSDCGRCKPYSDSYDINFFVFEIVDFKNNFYIVPIDVLIKKGYIRTDADKGKNKILIPNPDTHNGYHWINIYKNNFDLLKL